jgi:protein CMS1
LIIGLSLIIIHYLSQKRKLAETVEVIEPLSVAVQPAHKLADYVSSMQVKAFPAMSGIELSDVLIPGKLSYISTRRMISFKQLDSIIDCGYDEMDGIEIIRQSG